MFTGEFNHTLDSKNRLFIPAKHREELGEDFMVVRSIRENCIKVYSLDEWDNFLKPIMALPRKTGEATLRFLHRNAAKVSPDSQGRILLPQGLVDHAQIARNAVVVGCGNYAEIWSDVNYEAMVEDEDLGSMKELLESFGL